MKIVTKFVIDEYEPRRWTGPCTSTFLVLSLLFKFITTSDNGENIKSFRSAI